MSQSSFNLPNGMTPVEYAQSRNIVQAPQRKLTPVEEQALAVQQRAMLVKALMGHMMPRNGPLSPGGVGR